MTKRVPLLINFRIGCALWTAIFVLAAFLLAMLARPLPDNYTTGRTIHSAYFRYVRRICSGQSTMPNQPKKRGPKPKTEITAPQRRTLLEIDGYIRRHQFAPTMQELARLLPPCAHPLSKRLSSWRPALAAVSSEFWASRPIES